MNDIVMNIGMEEINFDLEQYNQMYIMDYHMGFKILMKLKEFESEKFDDYYNTKFKGNLYIYNQKVNKKNLIVIDLNDFSKIINNLTFEKNSLLKKIYMEKILNNINEDEFYNTVVGITDILKVDDKIKFQYKDIEINKIIDYLFHMYIDDKNEYLKNPNLLVDIIIEYLDNNLGLKMITIIDSSIKAFDFEKLVNDERIIVIDTALNINKKSSNLLLVKKDIVESINIQDLIYEIENRWPEKTTYEEIFNLLNLYFRIILNDEVHQLDKPSNNLLTMYYIIRKLFNLDITYEITKETEMLSPFLKEKML